MTIKIIRIILILGVIMTTMNTLSVSAETSKQEQQNQQALKTSRFNDGKYHNYVEWDEPSWLPMLWEFLFGDGERVPKEKPPIQQIDLTAFNNTDKSQLSSTWIGHSSLMININGTKILTDPVFETKVSIFGPTRYNGDAPLNPDDLPEIDLVLISHNHYDHLNKYSIQKIKDKTKQFIVPLAVGKLLVDWGVDPQKIIEMNWWDKFDLDGQLTIAATPAQHFSGRGLMDRNETLWVSFSIISKTHRIFYSGDSGYFTGFKEIGEKYGPFDMTFLECGAYDKAWHFVHMMPEEVIQAHLDLKGNILHPIHWGTFNLAYHDWFDPMQRLSKAAAASNIQVATPITGETTIFNTKIPNTHWWKATMLAKTD
jgi:L-ascorbate metabolism protein UlaG (beta-lactamase superfamily)